MKPWVQYLSLKRKMKLTIKNCATGRCDEYPVYLPLLLDTEEAEVAHHNSFSLGLYADNYQTWIENLSERILSNTLKY